MHREFLAAACLLTACGRIGFDPLGGDDGIVDGATGGGDGSPGDGTVGDGADAPMANLACADMNLGSATGASVASGTTSGTGNDYSSCMGTGQDLTFGWIAPVTGTFQIDTCGSDRLYDSTLSIRDGSCTGPSLGCSNDVCGLTPSLHGRLTVNLTAGQGIVIFVDTQAPPDSGSFQLAINQM